MHSERFDPVPPPSRQNDIQRETETKEQGKKTQTGKKKIREADKPERKEIGSKNLTASCCNLERKYKLLEGRVDQIIIFCLRSPEDAKSQCTLYNVQKCIHSYICYTFCIHLVHILFKWSYPLYVPPFYLPCSRYLPGVDGDR